MKIFERKLYRQIISQINDREFVIIVGARQTGKSTILKQLASFLDNINDSYIELTLEDRTILNKLNEHPENLFLYTPKPQANERKFVLIDEIQYLQNPTNFLKLLYDKYADSLKLIVTGSSAFYLDPKFKDSLAGRKQLHELTTLDFEEFLLFKTDSNHLINELKLIRENENYLSLKRKELAIYFSEYLTFGAYPAVVLAQSTEKKKLLLKELLNSFVKRDIDEANIQYQDKFYQLMMLLAEQTGNLLNTNELSSTLGLSTTSISNYLYVLQKCFHISLLKPFYRNLRKELTKMPKVYFNDLGMRNILLNNFGTTDTRIDKGILLENYIHNRLKEVYGEDVLRYWRTSAGQEVDFVVLQGIEKGFAIESKFRQTAFNVNKYKVFTEAYPDIPLQARHFNSDVNSDWVLGL